MKTGHPGMFGGTAQSGAANQMLDGLQDTLVLAASGPVLDGVGAIVDGVGAIVDGVGAIVDGAVDLGGALGSVFRQCFVAGTPVQMADGSTKPIEQVKAGDRVMSRNPDSGKTEVKRVARTFRHNAPETLTVQLADSETGKVVQTLTATPNHPFFVVGRGAVALGSLGLGTQIVTRAGPPLVVASLVRHSDPEGVSVFNFEVEDDHTYFVGTAGGGTWVHNDCTADAKDALKNLRGQGGDGEIVHLAPIRGNGGVPIDGTAYPYHDVVRTSGGSIIDKMTNGHMEPVSFEQWEEAFNNKLGWNYWEDFGFRPGSGSSRY